MPARHQVYFAEMQNRLVERLRTLIHTGEMTERGLARLSGLSQPHVHNLIKGIRTATAESADSLLRAIGQDVRDLLTGDERAAPHEGERQAAVPLLAGVAGEGYRWEEAVDAGRSVPFHSSDLAAVTEPAAVRVAGDARMGCEGGIALIDRALEVRHHPQPDSVYVVARRSEACLRWIRHGRACLYLATDANLDRPLEWDRLPLDAPVEQYVRARVCVAHAGCLSNVTAQ